MCDKGLVVDLIHPETGEAKYVLAPPLVGFLEFSLMRRHDSIPKKRMAEAIEAYTHGDPAFAEEVFSGATVLGRALVNETALEDVVERSLRMAMERGRLAHLLFDEGGGRGSRFLHQALKALNALPGAQRALASEQVSSRFIRAALSQVKDPTGG